MKSIKRDYEVRVLFSNGTSEAIPVQANSPPMALMEAVMLHMMRWPASKQDRVMSVSIFPERPPGAVVAMPRPNPPLRAEEDVA